MLKIFIGLIVPFVGVIGLLPVVTSTDFTVHGIPFAYLWITAWFFLTSGCLFACWKIFDERAVPAVHQNDMTQAD